MNLEVIGYRRQLVKQQFTIGTANSRIYYAAPQPSIIEGTGRIDLIYSDKPDNTSMNVSVARPLRVMKRGETYTASSLLSVATAHELRATSNNYPEWVSGPKPVYRSTQSPHIKPGTTDRRYCRRHESL